MGQIEFFEMHGLHISFWTEDEFFGVQDEVQDLAEITDIDPFCFATDPSQLNLIGFGLH